MKRISTVLLLLALGLPVLAADSFPINVYPCPRAKSAPVLDGKLEDAVWQDAPVVSGFTVFETDTLANPQTSFRLLWDDQNLYLGVHCDEPQMDKLSPAHYARDEHAVFHGEAIEFFVDPNHTHDLYYQLALDVAGSLYDGEREATVWESNAQVTTCAGPDSWSAEVAVPWEPLGAKPQAGKVVGFNVSRDRSVGESTLSTWARVMNGFHDPERFAHLVLSGTPETIGRLSQEFRKGGRTGPIVVYSAEGFARTSYASLATAAFAEVAKLLASLDDVRLRETDPATAAEIKRRTDGYATRLADMKTETAGPLDGAQWTRLDLALQGLTAALQKAVGEARLKALLDRI